jgi:hypothetical protein
MMVVQRDRASADEPTNASATNLEQLQNSIRTKMKAIFRTRTLHGFPVNIPYRDVDDVITKVRLHSQIYINDHYTPSIYLFVV